MNDEKVPIVDTGTAAYITEIGKRCNDCEMMRARVETLRAENERLKVALDKITRLEPGLTTGGTAAWIATEALRGV